MRENIAFDVAFFTLVPLLSILSLVIPKAVRPNQNGNLTMEKSQKEAQKKVSGSGIGNSRAIEIDDNIPVPSYYKPRGKGNRKYPWNEMEINQSFFVPDMKVRRFSSQVQLACKKYKKRFIVRDWKCDDGVEGVRVWRIE